MTVDRSMHVRVLLLFAVPAGVRLPICVSLYASVSMNGLPTRVRSHLTLISYSPETSGSQSREGNGDGLSQI